MILHRNPQKIAAAKEMKARGLSNLEISVRLGVVENTIWRWLQPGSVSKRKPAKQKVDKPLSKRQTYYASGRRGGE